MLHDQKLSVIEQSKESIKEISKVFYLEESEVVELEMPLIVDVTKLLSGRIIVTTRSIYPVNKFVNLDLTISNIKYSLIGKIKSFKVVESRLYEITILLEEVPDHLLLELESFYIEK